MGKQCLNKEYSERMSAEMLLKHSFLKEHNPETMAMRPVENMKDLQFMTTSLIEYYSSFDSSFKQNVTTPIDGVHSDEERLENIAKSSGFSVEFVEEFIKTNV